MQKYIIALYIRLSLEDSKYDSLSIENQRMILNEFLCQLYCDGVKLEIENVLCIQIYQWVDSNGEEGGDPVVVAVPIGAGENLNKEGMRSNAL